MHHLIFYSECDFSFLAFHCRGSIVGKVLLQTFFWELAGFMLVHKTVISKKHFSEIVFQMYFPNVFPKGDTKETFLRLTFRCISNLIYKMQFQRNILESAFKMYFQLYLQNVVSKPHFWNKIRNTFEMQSFKCFFVEMFLFSICICQQSWRISSAPNVT